MAIPEPEDGNWPEGCGYQGYEYGAGTYPDSICVGGSLFDADDCDEPGTLREPDEDMPCPICREDDAIAYWTERNGDSKSARSLVADIRRNRDPRLEPSALAADQRSGDQ